MKIQDLVVRIKKYPFDAFYWSWLVLFPFSFEQTTLWHGLAYGFFLWIGVRQFHGLWKDKS